MMESIIPSTIGIIIGLFFGALSVYIWHTDNYNTRKYYFIQYSLNNKIKSLKTKLSMREFENEMLYQKIIKDNKIEDETPIQDICKKYQIPIQDLPEVLEEYIATDNEEYLEKLKNQ